MRGWIAGAVLGAVVLCAAPAQGAADGGAVRKLGRGLGNIATGWLELFAQPAQAAEASGSFAAVTIGLGRGVLLGVGRTAVGVLELITFPIPNPTTGYEPILQPEFVTFRNADRWD